MTQTPSIDPVLMPMIRKIMPQILAQQIIGVQPVYDPMRRSRIRVSKENYRVFLRINDRPRTHTPGAFSDAGYPIVEIKDFLDVIPAIRWCREQFGEHGFIRYNPYGFILPSEDAATAFRMRWL